MQMVHVEDRYIGKEGEVDWKGAQGAQHGVAILSICFYVDNTKPSVRFKILWINFDKDMVLNNTNF